ncbi:MAG: FAD-dependent oxidoreductase [Verrucomicrobiales bacterium]|nr:FAD-dependent oxidoreductase [Verrucomicrobiales bacterium]
MERHQLRTNASHQHTKRNLQKQKNLAFHCFTSYKQKPIQVKRYPDSMGIGNYQIDVHSSNEGNNYINFPALPFEIPLGSLIPERLNNLIATAKNIGTTHVTNGCYRLHPVEWNIGEVAGYLTATSIKKKSTLRAIRSKNSSLNSFQRKIQKEGI